MQIDFDHIAVERFKSINTLLEIDFAALASGLHFVRGRNEAEPRLAANGAGKSSVFDAICWCLYGKTPDGLRTPDIRPWGGNGTTRVALEITIDGTLRRIARQAAPNRLELDGTACGQENIDQLLGVGFNLFTSTILLGQGQPLFFDLAPRDKMNLIANVLGLERWEKLSDAAKKKADDIDRDIVRKEGEAIRMDAEHESLTKQAALLKQRADVWTDESAARIEALRAEQRTTTKLLNEIVPQRGAADLALDGAATELRALHQLLTDLHHSLREVERNHAQFEGQVQAAEDRLNELRAELANIKTAKRCPTCGAAIKAGDPATLAEHRKEIERGIAQAEKIVAMGVPPKVRQLRDKHTREIDRLANKARELQTKMDDAQAALNNLLPRVARAEADLRSINERLQLAEREDNPYAEQYKQAKRRLTKLESERRITTELLNKQREAAERTRYWTRGFKDVRLYLIEEFLQELEIATNAALVDVGLDGWQVLFDVERETKTGTTQHGLSVTILSPHNESSVRWESWSGGEGQRLRVIGALALSDVLLNHAGVSCSLEILDEPSRSISGEGIRDLCDWLADRAEAQGKQVFLVDHHAIPSHRFASILTLVKDRTGTHLADSR